VSAWFSRKYFLKKSIISANQFEDLIFYTVIFALIGARFGHVVFFNFDYYLHNPVNIIKVWHGGLSIQGALLFGILTVFWWAQKHHKDFWKLTDGIVLVVPLGQAIGRWGNYFNQELFGRPVSWGKELKNYKTVPQGVRAMMAFNEISYEAHFHGARGYMFRVQGIDYNVAPPEVIENYEKNFIRKGKKLEVVAIPDEEDRLPEYYIPDVKGNLQFCFVDRYNLMLDPLIQVKKKQDILTI
jgi:hypothetical protein